MESNLLVRGHDVTVWKHSGANPMKVVINCESNTVIEI